MKSPSPDPHDHPPDPPDPQSVHLYHLTSLPPGNDNPRRPNFLQPHLNLTWMTTTTMKSVRPSTWPHAPPIKLTASENSWSEKSE